MRISAPKLSHHNHKSLETAEDMNFKVIAKSLVPVLFLGHLQKLRKYGNKGCYKTFNEAFRKSTSYESELIIKYVSRQTKDLIQTSESNKFIAISQQRLLAAILYSIDYLEGRLHVLDFGGGLGSHYHGIKRFVFPVILE